MVHVMPRIKLAYFPVPKVACTSIKEFLYEIGYGRPYAPTERKDGTRIYIHQIIKTEEFDTLDLSRMDGFHRIAVVRDPIERFLSAFGNRVIYHRELSVDRAGPALARLGLPADPHLDAFIEHFAGYRAAVPSIRHHTDPAVAFLGTNPTYFTRVYRFSELAALAEDVRKLTGVTVQMPRRQTGGPKFARSALSPRQTARLQEFYAADYAFLERLGALETRLEPRPAPGDTP